MEEFYGEMTKYNIETDEKFNELDKKVLYSYSKIINKEDIITRTINANGDYSIPVKGGTYYVLFISKNRTGSSMSEALGQIYCEKIKIKESKTKDVSYNFDLF